MLRLFVLSVLATFLLDANGLPSICQSQEAAQGAAHTPSTAPSTLSNPSTLADGTEVRLRLIEDLSSANAAFGESVGFEVLEDVELQDIIVIHVEQWLGAQSQRYGARAEWRVRDG